MPLLDIEEEISFTNTDIQEETDEIYRVLGEMTEIEYLGGDASISGVKRMPLREHEK